MTLCGRVLVNAIHENRSGLVFIPVWGTKWEKQQLTDVTLIKSYLPSLGYGISLVRAVSALILTQDCPQISVWDCVEGRPTGTVVIRTLADVCAAQFPVD